MKAIISRILGAPVRISRRLQGRIRAHLEQVRTASAEEYRNPTGDELAEIEQRLRLLGLPCSDLVIDTAEFEAFLELAAFPADYHGGMASGVYREKLLEHFVAWKFLSLREPESTPYLDLAAGGSPWALLLRRIGMEAYALDLSIAPAYGSHECYLRRDATKTGFADGSVGSASLQCAYEMFEGSQDMELLLELSRILKPGGRGVISPLYMHTHPCYYQTPDCYGRVSGDDGAKRYLRRDCRGVPASRKYSPETLKARVWDRAVAAGLLPSLYVLRNKGEVGEGIYLHFVLVLDKPAGTVAAKGEKSS